MPRIVKSTLPIKGSILAWNEREMETLIQDKERILEEKAKQEETVIEEKNDKVVDEDDVEEVVVETEKKSKRNKVKNNE